ncbi:histone-lysine N-methyltransferase SETMAR-like [Stegodyphus dumicola]|uniref:histone-lysine N-methyltransferase SETMAR-like n=1 Tax=Stegodyphus dumicola TaxID=202533 RepID=UPI0015AB4732|nr:histone-lysine N-methyltransferase SETMAR-like [Stegodyphus dumicola]
MVIAFFECDGLIHQEFLSPNMIINEQVYTEVFDRLRKRIRRVRPHFQQNGSWLLLHDNARPHITLPVRRFLAQYGGVEMQHPPYSPDLAPVDFFLFPKLKTSLKGTRFQDVEAIKKTITSLFKSIPNEDFKTSFRNLYNRAQTCITADGDYFESY